MNIPHYLPFGEFFPPTQEELDEIISKLEQMLEDIQYEEKWKELAKELEYRREQKELINQTKHNERIR